MVSATAEMKVTALLPYYGCNRMLAEHVGHALDGCKWVGVAFAGGMPELAHIKASTLVVNEIHPLVVNLARCVADDDLRRQLIHRLDRLPFHPDVLAQAQQNCERTELDGDDPFLPAAADYFVSQWMGRSGNAGKAKEFDSKLPVRWNANGGDSNTRYRSAVKSLAAWGRIMRRCNFTEMDFREFLPLCKDEPRHGIYADPPFPAGGDEYRFNSGKTDAERRAFHTELRDMLDRFTVARVVIRYYAHPLIQELYPEGRWHWQHLEGRKQSNAAAPEVLITNFPKGELF